MSRDSIRNGAGRAALLAVLLLGLAATAGDVVSFDPTAYPFLVDAAAYVPDLIIDLKYAGSDNFMKRKVYGDLGRCYLHREAAERLRVADATLKKERPELHFLVYDCARPLAAQWAMWEAVKGTARRNFVGNPDGAKPTRHVYGLAVDLTLAGRDGKSLDMGTPFDHFGPKAGIRNEDALEKEGKLTPAQVKNRLLLRRVMRGAGFFPADGEWWHFNAPPKKGRYQDYRRIE